MNKKWILIGLAVVLVFFTGCSNGSNEIAITETTEKETAEIGSKVDYDNIVGTYFYDYPDHSSDLLEDHYIRIEMLEDELVGYYYGTTDDFDEAREGYQTGFFVTDMKDLAIDGNAISFSLQLFSKDIFTYPVALKYTNSAEISKGENKSWINASIFSQQEGLSMVYYGVIEDGKIILKIKNENRAFEPQLEDQIP